MKKLSAYNNGTFKIIQITDAHLFANDELEMFGIKSNLKFQEVIDKVRLEEIDNETAIFLTGDLSQDESLESYQKIVNYIDSFNIPVYWIPGNHDNISHMELTFNNAKNFYSNRRLLIAGWNLIFLNTKKDGIDEGYLSNQELLILKSEINAVKEGKIAIIMHHHPAPVGTPLIDNYILKNRNEFWELIRDTNVELIICGHVHGDYSFKYDGVLIESSPATCVQWVKGTTEFKIDPKIGFKIHYFKPNSHQSITKIW